MAYDKEGRWSRLTLYLWGAWVALVIVGFAILEGIGLRKEGDPHPPLTYVIRRYLPAWLFFTVLGGGVGWLAWHFILTYST